jgi:hypothetical protein
MSDWSTVAKVVPPAISGFGVLVSITSALLAATNVGRQAPGAFRRVTGYLLASIGFVALAAGPAVWALTTDKSTATWSTGDRWLAGSTAVGLVLLVAGARRARNAPVDRDGETLSLLAATMFDRLGPAEPATGPFGTVRADLRVARGAETVAESLRSASDMVTILAGSAGCGKSTSMRTLTRDICRKAMSSRSPGRMAVYVDLANLTSPSAAPTAEEILAFILDEVSRGYPKIRTKLEASLTGDADRASWLFLLDSIDEISSLWPTDRASAATADFLSELHRFLRLGGVRFRAVLATRDDVVLPAGTRVTGIAPLTHAAQRRLIEKAGIEDKRALARLRQSAAEVAGRPLAFRLWCEEMRSDAAARARAAAFTTVHELIEATVDARLGRAAASTQVPFDDLRALSEDVAALIAGDPKPRSVHARDQLVVELGQRSGRTTKELEAGLDALVISGLATEGRPHTFTFSHRSFQDLCGARWLIRSVVAVDLDTVLSEKRWSAPVALALEIAPDDIRRVLLSRATACATALSGCLLPDVDKYLAIGPASALPLVLDPSGTAPEIDPALIHVLTLAAATPVDTLNLAPPALSDLADRLVVTAFARGDVMERQAALAVTKLLTPKVAAWTVERTVRHGGWLLETAALAMSRAPVKVTDLDLRVRFMLLGELAAKPILRRTVAARPSPDGGRSTLPAVVHAMTTALRAGCLMVGATCLYGLIRARTGAGAFLLGVGVVLCAAVLLITYRREDGQNETLELLFGSLFAAVTAASAAVGVLATPVFLIQLISGDLAALFYIAIFYLLSWSFFMAIAIVLESSPWSRQDWVLPHWIVARNAGELIALLPPVPVRRLLRNTVVAVAAIVALIYLANGPIPFVAGKAETTTRQIVAGVLLVGLTVTAVQRSLRRDTLFRSELRRAIADGNLTGQALHAHVMNVGGGERRMQLLVTELGRATAEALRSCERVLVDLARALDHVTRIVPANTKTRIPAAVWDLDQRLTVPETRRWLEDFDAAHPGRLSWLATNHGDAFARIAGALRR